MTAVRMTKAGGRAMIESGGKLIDVAKRSGGKFSADPMVLFSQWEAFADWARSVSADGSESVADASKLELCVPSPRGVFAIGLNYRDHAAEASLEIPKTPMVFTKFPSCLAGPTADVPLTSNRVDWEAELVVVIGRGGQRIAAKDAIGKSAAAFGPIGPAVVSLDGFANPLDLAISCDIGNDRMQDSRTGNMIFNVPELVEFLSRWCELAPGDLIFTGTPSGVGSVRDPRRYLQAGEVITTRIEGIGEIRNRCVPEAA
jgi:2-keto-4-pentenoate hydratase/2-oxohepta-3-ene-1,7-dioic acid hydratase in catechol pathway